MIKVLKNGNFQILFRAFGKIVLKKNFIKPLFCPIADNPTFFIIAPKQSY